jgi:multidrug efflux pump subunit AcrB
MAAGRNVVEVGARLDKRLRGPVRLVPLGMDLDFVYNQPEEVERSVRGFITSVGAGGTIVIVVLLLFMGLRTGLVIGAVLLITVAGTLLS